MTCILVVLKRTEREREKKKRFLETDTLFSIDNEKERNVMKK